MASSTPNDDWFQSAAAAQIRSERFERAELFNGRAAMIGFMVGVLTEALTGHGSSVKSPLVCSAATEPISCRWGAPGVQQQPCTHPPLDVDQTFANIFFIQNA